MSGVEWMEQLKEYESLFPFIEELIVNEFNINYAKKSLPKGVAIFHEGDSCEGVPFVVKGCIRVSKIGKNGKEMSVYRVNAGETCILSVMSILTNEPYPLTAIVEEDAEAFIIPYEEFKKLMGASSDFQDYIYKTIMYRFQEVIKVMDEVIFHSTDERIIKFLLKYTENDGDMIEATHVKIAMEIGTAREVVSRLLKEMERKGWVHLSRGKVFVIKRTELVKKLEKLV